MVRFEGDNRDLLRSVDQVLQRFNRLTDAEQRTTRATQDLNRALREARGLNVGQGIQNAVRPTQQLTNRFTQLNGVTRTLIGSFRDIARSVQFSAVFQGINLVQTAISDAADEAIRFSRAIAEIQTIDTSNFGFENIQEQLRVTSDTFGISVIDQAEAAYQALSNQVVDAANSQEFLEAANRLAVTAVTDASSAVNLLTSGINAFGLEAEDADRLSAQFFRVVELGRIRVDDLANTFGRIGVPAANLGVSFEELGGALAVITRRGVQANEAITFLRGIFQQLTNPSEALAGFIGDLGFASGEAAIRTLGLNGVLQELQNATGGASTEIAELFRRIRAITGIQVFDPAGLEELREATSALNNVNLDEFDQKTQQVLDNVGTKVQLEANRLRNFFTVELGQRLIEGVATVTEAAGGFENIIEQTANVLQASLVPAAGLAALATVRLATATQTLIANQILGISTSTGLAGALGALNRAALALLTNPVFLAGAGLATGFLLISNEIENTVAAADRLNERFTQSNEEIETLLQTAEDSRLSDFANGLDRQTQQIRQGIQADQSALTAQQREVRNQIEDTFDSLRTLSSSAGRAISSQSREFSDSIRDIQNAARTASRDFDNLQNSISRLQFDNQIEDLGLTAQLDVIDQRIESLRQQSFLEQDPREFTRIRQEINSLARERINIAERVGQAELDFAERIAQVQASAGNAFNRGDIRTFQRLNQQAADLQSKLEANVNLTSEEAEQRGEIIDAQTALNNAINSRADNTVIDSLSQRLELLIQQETRIKDQIDAQADSRESLLTLVEEEQRIRAQLAASSAQQAAALEQQRLRQQLLGASLTDTFRQFTSFDIDTILSADSAEEAAAAFTEQKDRLEEILALQRTLGVEVIDQARARQTAIQLEAAAQNRLAQEIATQQEQQLNARQDAAEQEFRALNAQVRSRQGLARQALADARELSALFTEAVSERGSFLDNDSVNSFTQSFGNNLLNGNQDQRELTGGVISLIDNFSSTLENALTNNFDESFDANLVRNQLNDFVDVARNFLNEAATSPGNRGQTDNRVVENRLRLLIAQAERFTEGNAFENISRDFQRLTDLQERLPGAVQEGTRQGITEATPPPITVEDRFNNTLGALDRLNQSIQVEVPDLPTVDLSGAAANLPNVISESLAEGGSLAGSNFAQTAFAPLINLGQQRAAQQVGTSQSPASPQRSLITQEQQLREINQNRIDQINDLRTAQLNSIQEIEQAQIDRINAVRQAQINEAISRQENGPDGAAETILGALRNLTGRPAIGTGQDAEEALRVARENNTLATVREQQAAALSQARAADSLLVSAELLETALASVSEIVTDREAVLNANRARAVGIEALSSNLPNEPVRPIVGAVGSSQTTNNNTNLGGVTINVQESANPRVTAREISGFLARQSRINRTRR